MNKDKSPRLFRLGIRGKLSVAICAITALTTFATGVALWEIGMIRRNILQINQNYLPSIILSQQLQVDASAAVAQAPVLDTVNNPGDLAMLGDDLKAQMGILLQGVDELAPLRADDERPAFLKEAIGKMSTAQNIQIEAVSQRLAIRAKRLAAVHALQMAHGNFTEQLKPMLADSRTSLETGIVGADRSRLDRELDSLLAELELIAAGNMIVSLVTEAAGVSDQPHIDALRANYTKLVNDFPALQARLSPAEAAAIAPSLQRMAELGLGEDGIFALFTAELASWTISRTALNDNRAFSEELRREASRLVHKVRGESTDLVASTEAGIEAGRRTLIAIGACSVIGTILISWLYIGYFVVNRLARLAQSMRRVAAGDLDVSIPVRGHDEIADMGLALEIFRANASEALNERYRTEQDRKRAGEERRAAFLRLAGQFETTFKTAVERFAGSAVQMHTTAETMARFAGQAITEAASATTASRTATNSVETVASAAEELSASISEIGRQVQESARIAGVAVTDARDTDAAARSLNEAAARIGEVVRLIGEIAAQTNLLALNATIEAARAGEAGRSFAVVANEVKLLATQTARETEDIDAQITAMQSVTGKTVEAIHKIVGTIGTIDGITGAIAAAIHQQGAATQEIARNVIQAADGTHRVLSSIETIRSASQQTGEAAGQVVDASAQMTDEADALSRDVADFLALVRAG